MTPTWRPDWGGALQFYDERGNIVEGFMPCMNTLNVFTIPQRHAVSLVAPFARADRFSVTGWFRTGRDPKGAPSTV